MANKAHPGHLGRPSDENEAPGVRRVRPGDGEGCARAWLGAASYYVEIEPYVPPLDLSPSAAKATVTSTRAPSPPRLP